MSEPKKCEWCGMPLRDPGDWICDDCEEAEEEDAIRAEAEEEAQWWADCWEEYEA